MKRYAVFLTAHAERDVEQLYEYVSNRSSPQRADHLLEKLEAVLESLGELPERGAVPKELSALGIREFHEVHFKPYRMIYRVTGARVFVYLVTDGRRDMQALLSRRMLADD